MKTKMPFSFKSKNIWILFLPFLFFSEYEARYIVGGAETKTKTEKLPLVSSILIFGDSTADPGNNNYINTLFKSNFSPYGRDLVNHTATGRFCNGRLANDYIADYVGVKEMVPPYLDPTLTVEELMTGVSFASAGSGFDPLTPTISNVIALSEQLEYLREYRRKVEAAAGKEKAAEVISNALFLVSAGTNDFVVNFFSMPIRRRNYTVQTYTNLVTEGAREFLQGLIDEGARRIGVVGLPPMGCLPVVITLYTDDPIVRRDCNGNFSAVARGYNENLQRELKAMEIRSGARVGYLDAYTPLEEMARFGSKYGFDVLKSGCCGTGMIEASFMCNGNTPVCDDATKYVFWDSIHPTQRSYQLLFQSFRPTIDYLVSN